jgi:hypothetical protein
MMRSPELAQVLKPLKDLLHKLLVAIFWVAGLLSHWGHAHPPQVIETSKFLRPTAQLLWLLWKLRG